MLHGRENLISITKGLRFTHQKGSSLSRGPAGDIPCGQPKGTRTPVSESERLGYVLMHPDSASLGPSSATKEASDQGSSTRSL